MEKTDLKDYNRGELERWVIGRGYKPFRARQVLDSFYRGGVTDFRTMNNIPAKLRTELDGHFCVEKLVCLKRSAAADGTRKYLFTLADGRRIESVLIPSKKRRTLCVSSQAGCAMGCRFCATATVRPVRNLFAREIVAQVLAVQSDLGTADVVSNLVLMGMGEPLANYEQVIRAIDTFTADWGLKVPPRRVTVSTVGLVPQMRRLLRETKVNLTISLTATCDEVRDSLMPVNKRYPLAVIMDVCRTQERKSRKRITFAYTLLRDVNDSPRDARRLVSLLHGVQAKVNLIPFNSFTGTPFRASSREAVLRFRQVLLDKGVYAAIRESRGEDVQAACGQLAAA